MPCYTPGPNNNQKHAILLQKLLVEVGLLNEVDLDLYYGSGNPDTNKLSELLCNWCKNNDVTKQSQELILWWGGHKLWDELNTVRLCDVES